MKIITWNCNGALRQKLAQADSLEADVLVIQECEDPARSTSDYRDWAGNYLWVGENKNRGIGVFAKNANVVQKLEWSGSFSIAGLSSRSQALQWTTESLRLFLPFSINGEFTVLAVWTKGGANVAFEYIGQFWKYLQIHRQDLCSDKTIILGDFNSNARWDKADRWWNHSDVVAELTELGFSSQYHHNVGEPQGEESQPTFFLHRNSEKAYHIDYVFTSADLTERCSLELGNYSEWIEFSDHVPVELTIMNLTVP